MLLDRMFTKQISWTSTSKNTGRTTLAKTTRAISRVPTNPQAQRQTLKRDATTATTTQTNATGDRRQHANSNDTERENTRK